MKEIALYIFSHFKVLIVQVSIIMDIFMHVITCMEVLRVSNVRCSDKSYSQGPFHFAMIHNPILK